MEIPSPFTSRGESGTFRAPQPRDSADQIIVACVPKSGSTYIAKTLQRYFEIPFDNRSLTGYDWHTEQNLIPWLEHQVRYQRFILQIHLLPHAMNLEALARLKPATIFLWRNLADVLVSCDDHIRNESHRFPTFYVHDRDNYLRLPDQERYGFLIRFALPFYLAFYLSWRARAVRFRTYEAMVADQQHFFADIITEITGAPADPDRLTGVLDTIPGSTRFNAGVVGRSAEQFSEETKRALEAAVRTHPEFDRLRVLLHELPWVVPGASGDDARLLRDAATGATYFIDGGTRQYVTTPVWIQSRWPALPVEDVSSEVLARFPRGIDLT
jgi:hypothetical protein